MTIKVLRLHGVGDLRLHDEPDPVPGPGESLVRVEAVGLCGSDVHWFSEAAVGDARLEEPLVLGHEFAGIVESGELSGRRVAVDPAMPCGECEWCLEGNPNLCPAVRFAGSAPIDGALRERVAWPTHCLHPLPESLTAVDGAMLEPLGVAIHSVDLAHLGPGMTVAVLGCGPIGLLTLQVARALGAARLFATDVLPHRLEAARSLGATSAMLACRGEEATDILAATNGRGVDVAFEAAGENEAVEVAVDIVRPGGKVILAGIPVHDRTTFTASTARRKGLTIKLVRRMRLVYPRAIELVETGKVNLQPLVTHRFSLDEADEAFSIAAKREGIKVVLEL
jgi:L-iditol 2-dehydrogenase